MSIDPNNPVVALCAAGMAIEGDSSAARALFEQAWEARRDDYDASIAAHFLARHQPTIESRLHWNVLAARVAAAGPKPDAQSVRFVRAYPVMRIFDVAKAKDFYVDYLGFRVDFEHRFEPTLPLYMQVSRAGLALHLSEHYGDGTPGHHVHVRMRNMRAFHAELLAKSGHYQNPGVDEDAPGGPRLKVWDPFGNALHFAEATEG